MKIAKLPNTFNDYKLEVSFGELTSMLNALEDVKNPGPVVDEMCAAIDFYLQRVPGPGEDKEEFDAKKKAEKEMAAEPEELQEPEPMPEEPKGELELKPDDEELPEPPAE